MRINSIAVAIVVFGYLTLYDWFFGGGIGAELQRNCFSFTVHTSENPAFNQVINDLYQATFLVLVLVAALVTWLARAAFIFDVKYAIAGGAILFLGYVEDTMFYVLLGAINPFNYRLPPEVIPEYFSGWLGWLGRMAGITVQVPRVAVLVMNLAAIAAVSFMFVKKE